MGMTDGMGVTPVYNLDDRRDDGMFGGSGAWVFFLFFLLAWGGNGLGGFGGRGVGAVDAISNEFLYSNLNGQISRMQDQNVALSNSVQQGICDLGYANLSNFKDLQAQICNCCCETNRNIDAVRYENAKNTCDIITNANMNTRDLIVNQTANTQRIIDQMTQDKIDSLRDQLQSANLALQNNAQTATLIDQLRPCPIPAYLSCSPYATFGSPFGGPFGGCNNGCGCNGAC